MKLSLLSLALGAAILLCGGNAHAQIAFGSSCSGASGATSTLAVSGAVRAGGTWTLDVTASGGIGLGYLLIGVSGAHCWPCLSAPVATAIVSQVARTRCRPENPVTRTTPSTASSLPARIMATNGPSVSALALLAAFSLAPLASTQTPDGLTPSDMTGLRAAYEQGRHRVFDRGDGTYQARTHRRQFSTVFDGRGALVTPDDGEWTFGLELVSYGFEGSEVEVLEPERTGIDGRRLSYAWDDVVTEWYVNRDDGLEHGFTLTERPQSANEGVELRIELRVLGDLVPIVDDDGLGVRLFDGSGEVSVTYAGLVVTDARGRLFGARMTATSAGVSILVDETRAIYPLTIDPVVQQAYLKASNTDEGDFFGRCVAIDGDTIVVGAMHEDSSATGVDGNQTDDSAENAGAAYVFVRSGGSWSQQAYLKASNTNASDFFGEAVAISGNTIIVGAWTEDSNATGVDGDQSNNAAPQSGAAYVFERSDTTWTQQAYLKASNTLNSGAFGSSVAISGDSIVVGAWAESSAADGVNGNQADSSAPASGAAYVFVRMGNAWSQQAYLKASNSDAGDFFGYSVAIAVDTIIVGAWREASNAIGVEGDQANNSAADAGAAYVFVRSGAATWSQQAYLKASNTDAQDHFGGSVSISGETAVVGAEQESSNATGVDGIQSDNAAWHAGAAYIFERSGATWTQQAYLKASNAEANDRFGGSVDVSGGTVVVGAIYEDSSAEGIDGDQADNGETDSGAAYVFVRSGTTWWQRAYLKSSNANAGDWFGIPVAVSSDTVVVGALHEASGALGVGGAQGSNDAQSAGAAYVFLIASILDCNGNGILDPDDIAAGTSTDCNGNGIPDDCDPDCNGNGVPDDCDIVSLFSSDCNGNAVPDECDIASGASTDFDSNGIPDDCIAPLLNTDRTTASVTTGAQVHLALRAGAASAFDVFVLLGSASGTIPGLADPVTGLVMPLNFDPYFELLYVSSGAGIVAPFFGFLDASGNAMATVTVPAATNPSLVGLHLDHAYLTIDLFGTGLMGLASNPVPLELTL
jgi:hypothetical protein